jgi:hypothetical protein
MLPVYLGPNKIFELNEISYLYKGKTLRILILFENLMSFKDILSSLF